MIVPRPYGAVKVTHTPTSVSADVEIELPSSSLLRDRDRAVKLLKLRLLAASDPCAGVEVRTYEIPDGETTTLELEGGPELDRAIQAARGGVE